jgi:copper chaperone
MSDTLTLKIEGMTCMHCVAAVKKALAAVDGVDEVVDVSLDNGSAVVRGSAPADALVAAVKASGYSATA